MRPFVLRRLKRHVLHTLPPKSEVSFTWPPGLFSIPQRSVAWYGSQGVERVAMPTGQKEAYGLTLQRIARQAREAEAVRQSAPGSRGGGGGATSDAKWVTNSFTELRKAAHHPLLLRRHYDSKVSRTVQFDRREPSLADVPHNSLKYQTTDTTLRQDRLLHVDTVSRQHHSEPTTALDGHPQTALSTDNALSLSAPHTALRFSTFHTAGSAKDCDRTAGGRIFRASRYIRAGREDRALARDFGWHEVPSGIN